MNMVSLKTVKTSNLLTVLVTTVILISWAHACLALDVALQWDPNSEPDLAGYRIYYTAGEIFDANGAVMAADAVRETTATIRGLDAGHSYSFAVTAYNQSNSESGYSNSVTVSDTVDPLSPPVTSTTVVTDTTAPSIAIISPANNSTVTGSVTVSSTAVDNVAVSRVEFYENGVFTAAMNVSPYTYIWNTGNSPNGPVTLTARAFDASGNTAQSTVAVAVNNVTTQTAAVKVSSSTGRKKRR